MATVHANSPRDGLSRLEMMVSLSGLTIPEKSLRQQIASAITLIVHQSRLSDGRRRVMHVTEIVGMEQNVIELDDIFVFNRTGIDAKGNVTGEFRATGVRPKCMTRLEQFGIKLGPEIFGFSRKVGEANGDTTDLRAHILGRSAGR
jgi:pilus assembly protein CpaF